MLRVYLPKAEEKITDFWKEGEKSLRQIKKFRHHQERSQCIQCHRVLPFFLFFRLHRRLQENLRTIIVTPRYICNTHVAFYLITAVETCFPITET